MTGCETRKSLPAVSTKKKCYYRSKCVKTKRITYVDNNLDFHRFYYKNKQFLISFKVH